MTRAIVFTRKGRTYWLEGGVLFRWHRILWRWWMIPPRVAGQVGGDVLTNAAVLDLVAQFGTPFKPRVEAGCWLPCAQCGQVCGAERVHLGTRPFCSEAHRERFLRARAPVDSAGEAKQNSSR